MSVCVCECTNIKADYLVADNNLRWVTAISDCCWESRTSSVSVSGPDSSCLSGSHFFAKINFILLHSTTHTSCSVITAEEETAAAATSDPDCLGPGLVPVLVLVLVPVLVLVLVPVLVLVWSWCWSWSWSWSRCWSWSWSRCWSWSWSWSRCWSWSGPGAGPGLVPVLVLVLAPPPALASSVMRLPVQVCLCPVR